MRRNAIAVVVLIAAVSLVASALAATKPKAAGTVGPGFTITLKQGTKKVTSLKPGAYSLVIDDKSNIHNFHLRGPSVNKATSVPRIGKTTWNVTLRAGTYRFVCDPHASGMKGSFTVR